MGLPLLNVKLLLSHVTKQCRALERHFGTEECQLLALPRAQFVRNSASQRLKKPLKAEGLHKHAGIDLLPSGASSYNSPPLHISCKNEWGTCSFPLAHVGGHESGPGTSLYLTLKELAVTSSRVIGPSLLLVAAFLSLRVTAGMTLHTCPYAFA